MTPMWMPGAVALPGGRDGGSMLGGQRHATWHTFEAPYSLTALSGARALLRAGNEVHLVFNPVKGDVVNLLPANRAGRGLVNAAGGVETNRNGIVNIQVEVIGYARNPWTKDLTPAGRATLDRIIAWMNSLGIPQVSPAGPAPETSGGPFPRNATLWARNSGHFSHSQIPENWHWDHGGADWSVIIGGVSVPTPIPAKPAPQRPRNPAPVPRYGFPLPTGFYFGPKSGPKESVSGYFSHSVDLQHFQQQLVKRGWKIGTDGRYGPETYRVTTQFQHDSQLGTDGLIGVDTWWAAFNRPVT